MMERCTRAPEGLECLKLARHVGECDCVSTDVFNTAIQLEEDYFLYGCSYALQNSDGSLTRLDPTKIQIRCRGITGEMVARAKADAP